MRDTYLQDLVENVERSCTVKRQPDFTRPYAKQEAKEKARFERDHYKAVRKRLRQERGFEWRELKRGLLLGALSTISSATVTAALLVIFSLLSVR